MPTELVSTTILLILVTDPFGNVPLVVAALRGVRSLSCSAGRRFLR